jgi:hypothetical protein
MAQIDISQGFKNLDKDAQIFPKYRELKKDQKNLKKKVSNSFDKSEKFLKTQLSEWSEKKQEYQDTIRTAFEELVNLIKLTRGSGAETNSYVKKTLTKSLKEIKPDLKEILVDVIIKTLGCSTDFQVSFNQTQYIKLQSIDFFETLTTNSDSKLGKLIYEEKPISYFGPPFAMNKSLYDRIQNLNQPISAVVGTDYIGKSGEEIFDYEYVQSYVDPVTGNIVNGNFIKMTSSVRSTPLTVNKFLSDYFETIDLFDQKNFYTQLMNIITGSIFSYKDSSKSQISSFQKFMKICQRTLGLCYDSNASIDVSGNAKVSENDLIDDSFFQLTELDLRLIEENTSNIKRNIIQFEDCENLDIQMNTEAVIDALSDIEFIEGTNQTNFLEETSAVIYNTTDGRFKLAFDSSWIEQFPKALITAILSPKVVLPFMYLAKIIGKPIDVDSTVTLEDFTKNFKTFFIEFVSRVGAIFTKIIFNIVRKDIAKLIVELKSDIATEAKKRIKNMVFPLTILGIGIGIKILKDFRDCKSIVDDLTKLLSLALKKRISALEKVSGADVPLPLLFISKLLDGYSPTRAYINVVKQFEELGIPTGPMPDGSPNEFMASVFAIIDGMDEESTQNGKTLVALPALTVTPLFLTTPKKAYGKSV